MTHHPHRARVPHRSARRFVVIALAAALAGTVVGSGLVGGLLAVAREDAASTYADAARQSRGAGKPRLHSSPGARVSGEVHTRLRATGVTDAPPRLTWAVARAGAGVYHRVRDFRAE